MNKILEMFDDAMMNDFNEFEKELIVDAVEAGEGDNFDEMVGNFIDKRMEEILDETARDFALKVATYVNVFGADMDKMDKVLDRFMDYAKEFMSMDSDELMYNMFLIAVGGE